MNFLVKSILSALLCLLQLQQAVFSQTVVYAVGDMHTNKIQDKNSTVDSIRFISYDEIADTSNDVENVRELNGFSYTITPEEMTTVKAKKYCEERKMILMPRDVQSWDAEFKKDAIATQLGLMSFGTQANTRQGVTKCYKYYAKFERIVVKAMPCWEKLYAICVKKTTK